MQTETGRRNLSGIFPEDDAANAGNPGMRDAGFKETRVEPLCGPDSMVVGIK